nr:MULTISPECIES: Gfo/Idh/MocA family oxidoreductase [Myxococcaceae]
MGTAGSFVAAGGAVTDALAAAAEGAEKGGEIKLEEHSAKSERETGGPPKLQPPSQRVGYALVGLGHLTLEELLPAFAQCTASRPVALVSGDLAKARTVARQYGISEKSLYDYKTFDRIRDNPEVQVVYVVLPNSMHAEFTVRAAQAGKHVLCEKPMANTVAECEQMIEACRKAQRKLMVAYRMQYEPHHRALIGMARSGALGALKLFTADNGQHESNPQHWRLKRALAGGGALPDVGLYCLNASRYLSGEEPIEVMGTQYSTPGDARFKEVEEQFAFTLRFPSGLIAACTTGYSIHESRRLRLMGSEAWADMDPAFAYRGLRLRIARKSKDDPKVEEETERKYAEKSQFARELDHFSTCIQQGKDPHTPGEEGLQDQRLMEALYQSAREGKPVKLPPVAKKDAFRGPPPAQEA